jgi:hypothetical protein
VKRPLALPESAFWPTGPDRSSVLIRRVNTAAARLIRADEAVTRAQDALYKHLTDVRLLWLRGKRPKKESNAETDTRQT